jgi:flagellar assembly protein FliH
MSAVKFTFDTSFADAAAESRAKERARKTYSAEEIDALLAAARDEGRRHGDTIAMQQMASAIAQLSSAIVSAIETLDAEIETVRADAAHLALCAAKTLAGAALAAVPEAEVLETLKTALHHAIGEQRVVVRTDAALAQRLEKDAAEIAHHEGYEGRIQFVADPALGGADCRIEWRGGGIERSHRAIESALSGLIARRFASSKE